MGFTKYLEAVANPKHQAPFLRKTSDGLHQGTKTGDGPAAQVITIRKPAWENDAVIRGKHTEIPIFMPQHDHFKTKIILKCSLHIPIAIGAWKNDNTKFHGF